VYKIGALDTIKEALVGKVYTRAAFSKAKYSVIPQKPAKKMCHENRIGLFLDRRIKTPVAMRKRKRAVVKGGRL